MIDRGYLIYAQNTKKVNYIDCAKLCAKSLKLSMPNCHVTLLTDEDVNEPVFDNIVKLPYGDLAPYSNWKLINDWQVYEASPYKQTIKIEADIYVPYNIDYYWDVLSIKDVVVCTNIRNFKQELSKVKYYRRFITDNKLPDTYNGLTYFSKSKLAETFYSVVRNIFENWDQYKKILRCNSNEPATTDWVYSLASHIIGYEHTTLDCFTDFSFVHMKKEINNIFSENWTDNLIYEVNDDCFKINCYAQKYPVHYVNKNFCNML